MNATDFDIIIVGGSIAGSTAAYRLEKNGFSVLILDKEKFPRSKTCGDGITPKTIKHLPFKLEGKLVKPIYDTTLVSPLGKKLTLTTKLPTMYTCPRFTLDHYLLEEAKKIGVEVHEGERVIDILFANHVYMIKTDLATYTGRVLVGADGYSSIVRRKIVNRDYSTKSIKQNSFAIRGYLPNPQSLNKVILYLCPYNLKGYGWLFPTNHGINIGIGSAFTENLSLKHYFDQFYHKIISILGIDKTIIDEGTICGHYVPVVKYKNQFGLKNCLLIGDAANLVDSLSGEGMSSAVISGQLATIAITDALSKGKSIFPKYDKLIRQYLYNNLKYSIFASSIVHRFINPIFSLLELMPFLSRYFYSFVTGDVEYKNLINNPLKLVKLFMSAN